MGSIHPVNDDVEGIRIIFRELDYFLLRFLHTRRKAFLEERARGGENFLMEAEFEFSLTDDDFDDVR